MLGVRAGAWLRCRPATGARALITATGSSQGALAVINGAGSRLLFLENRPEARGSLKGKRGGGSPHAHPRPRTPEPRLRTRPAPLPGPPIANVSNVRTHVTALVRGRVGFLSISTADDALDYCEATRLRARLSSVTIAESTLRSPWRHPGTVSPSPWRPTSPGSPDPRR